METIKFASLHDFEAYSQKKMAPSLFEHLKGTPRELEHFSDFERIKLKLRGMMNIDHFKGLTCHYQGKVMPTPLGVGPLPSRTKIELATKPTINHGSVI
jgi:hypothetical protein